MKANLTSPTPADIGAVCLGHSPYPIVTVRAPGVWWGKEAVAGRGSVCDDENGFLVLWGLTGGHLSFNEVIRFWNRLGSTKTWQML